MKYIANVNIGKFKKGEEIPKEKGEYLAQAYDISPVDLVEDDVPSKLPEKKEELSPENKERLEDIKEDLKDDGKLNYSHDPNRKKPGRKKKSKKK